MLLGDNESGQLGCGDTAPRPDGVYVRAGLQDVQVASVGCGETFTIACTATGQLYVWGNSALVEGSYAELTLSPRVVLQSAGVKVIALSCSSTNTILVQEQLVSERNMLELNISEDVDAIKSTKTGNSESKPQRSGISSSSEDSSKDHSQDVNQDSDPDGSDEDCGLPACMLEHILASEFIPFSAEDRAALRERAVQELQECPNNGNLHMALDKITNADHSPSVAMPHKHASLAEINCLPASLPFNEDSQKEDHSPSDRKLRFEDSQKEDHSPSVAMPHKHASLAEINCLPASLPFNKDSQKEDHSPSDRKLRLLPPTPSHTNHAPWLTPNGNEHHSIDASPANVSPSLKRAAARLVKTVTLGNDTRVDESLLYRLQFLETQNENLSSRLNSQDDAFVEILDNQEIIINDLRKQVGELATAMNGLRAGLGAWFAGGAAIMAKGFPPSAPP